MQEILLDGFVRNLCPWDVCFCRPHSSFTSYFPGESMVQGTPYVGEEPQGEVIGSLNLAFDLVAPSQALLNVAAQKLEEQKLQPASMDLPNRLKKARIQTFFLVSLEAAAWNYLYRHEPNLLVPVGAVMNKSGRLHGYSGLVMSETLFAPTAF